MDMHDLVVDEVREVFDGFLEGVGVPVEVVEPVLFLNKLRIIPGRGAGHGERDFSAVEHGADNLKVLRVQVHQISPPPRPTYPIRRGIRGQNNPIFFRYIGHRLSHKMRRVCDYVHALAPQ